MAEKFSLQLSLKKWQARTALAILIILLVSLVSSRIVKQKKQIWRAVFLTNNQVYFGKFLYLPFWSTIKLTDIYYLQVNQPLQENETSAEPPPDIKVIKFGNEIHGPRDKMIIPKPQIIFWEDLRDDSHVVRAIEKNKGAK